MADRPDTASRTAVRAALVFAVAALSSAAIFIRELREAGTEPLAIAGWRMLASAALLLPGATRGLASSVRAHPTAYVVSGLSLAVHFGAWTASLDHIPVARSVLLVDLQPIFVALAAWAWLGERPHGRFAVAIVLALAGLVILTGGDAGGGSTTGDAFALTGAASIAGYVLIGRRLRESVGLADYVVPVYTIAGATLLTASALVGETLLPSGEALWPLVGLAVIPTLGGHTVFNWALRHVPARVVSMAFLGEPVGATLLAALFLGETPDGRTLAGGALCLAGVVLVVFRR